MSRQIEVIVRRPGHPERRVMLGEGITFLGRAEDNDLVLTDIGVSRRHARIVVQPRGAIIEDMGSGNGTFFDGQRVQRQALQDGDEILVDPFILSFRMHETATDNDGITAELEDVDDDDTVRVALRSSPAQETEERPAMAAPLGQLVTLVGQRLQELYTIEGALTMGRSEARDVILFDPAASRNHAAIEYMSGHFWLRDDGSANGTFVNSSRVREQCLRDGDRVRIGGTEFRFEIHTPAAAAGWVREQETRVRGMDQRVPAPPRGGRRQPVPPPSHGPIRLALIAGLGGFMVVVMMLLGVAIALQVLDEPFGDWPMVSNEPPPREGPELEPGVQARVDQLMERGSVHFDAGRYLDAAAQYYSVLKLVPGHAEAERGGYTACELLMVQTLHHGLVLRTLDPEIKKGKRLAAVRGAKKALSGRGDLDRAWSALREVAIFAPEDARVVELLQEMEARRATVR